MTRARDMANLGSQAGSGLDASDITSGALGASVTGGAGLGVSTAATTAFAPKASPIFTGIATAPSLVLTPTVTGSAPATTEGAIYFDSDKDSLMAYSADLAAYKSVSYAQGQGDGGVRTDYVNSSGVRYAVHTFKGDGIFTVTSSALTCNILVVAGGASGAYLYHGGGGGAGGLLEGSSISLLGSYIVTVGAGGARRTSGNQGANGSNSVFGSATALGGGGGGREGASSGLDGGSGGGGSYGADTKGDSIQGDSGGLTKYGFDGGNDGSYSGPSYPTGGGGGAGGPGGTGASGVVGAGGAGRPNSISGSPVTYAAGGHGCLGSTTGDQSDATPFTGNGSHGADRGGDNRSGRGGSGIIIISYITGA